MRPPALLSSWPAGCAALLSLAAPLAWGEPVEPEAVPVAPNAIRIQGQGINGQVRIQVQGGPAIIQGVGGVGQANLQIQVLPAPAAPAPEKAPVALAPAVPNAGPAPAKAIAPVAIEGFPAGRLPGLAGQVRRPFPFVLIGSEPAKVEKVKFAPESEKEMEGVMAKLRESKRKIWVERMDKEVEEIGTAAALSEEQKKALAAPVQQAIDNCLDLWIEKMDAMIRKTIQRQPRVLSQIFMQYRQNADNYAENDGVTAVKQPIHNDAWIKGWQGILQPPQIEKWNAVLAERLRVAREEMKEVLKPMEDRAREQFNAAIAVRVAEIRDTLNLPADRAATLEELSKQAIEQSMAAWNKRAETTILGLSTQRRKNMQMGRLFLGPEPLEVPELQAAWKEGVPKLLLPEEVKRLGSLKVDYQKRRVGMMAQLFLLNVDEKLALTNEQRQKLRPLAEQLVLKEPALFPPNNECGNLTSSPPIPGRRRARRGEGDPPPVGG